MSTRDIASNCSGPLFGLYAQVKIYSKVVRGFSLGNNVLYCTFHVKVYIVVNTFPSRLAVIQRFES